MLPGSSTSLTALFHGCGTHLKLLECVVDGTGEVVLEVRRLQKTDISSYHQKGTGAPQEQEQVANQFLAASGKQISRKTVARRLRGGGLYARRPVVCVPMTRQHRTARLQWCREHHNWTEQDWACVLFSDESRFSLSSDCRRQLIWRESGTAYRPENIQEKDRYPTCSIMVWAGIMINGRTRLHVVANGTMTGQRYIDEVLLPHVRLFRGAVGDKFVFMDDNATGHRTLAVQDCLDSEGIQRLVWPARCLHLNPIENVWDALGRQVAGRNYPPTNKNILIRALTEEWDKLPQQLLDNVVQSMVRRVECCITLHGGHIPYCNLSLRWCLLTFRCIVPFLRTQIK
ncbi:transposable element Tcb2 transposase [Trichonephila clavipes]|uniref:Transposable element Tcb2 transposase n=1 Tax=Trichonephila clavipes TaxID=2585209 RepID=A0A8X6SE85_TRICX|nr:transposable element Tcb2 transposase [Trichonephila clavipes]